MDHKWLWIGGGALVLLYLYSRSSSSGAAQVVPGTDTTQETQARFSFASAGLQSLSQLAASVVGDQAAEETQLGVAQAQASAVEASAEAQASAQQYTANAAKSAQNSAGMWGAIDAGIGALGKVLPSFIGGSRGLGSTPSYSGGFVTL